jgi:hypothetical protein
MKTCSIRKTRLAGSGKERNGVHDELNEGRKFEGGCVAEGPHTRTILPSQLIITHMSTIRPTYAPVCECVLKKKKNWGDFCFIFKGKGKGKRKNENLLFLQYFFFFDTTHLLSVKIQLEK